MAKKCVQKKDKRRKGKFIKIILYKSMTIYIYNTNFFMSQEKRMGEEVNWTTLGS